MPCYCLVPIERLHLNQRAYLHDRVETVGAAQQIEQCEVTRANRVDFDGGGGRRIGAQCEIERHANAGRPARPDKGDNDERIDCAW